MPVIEPGQASSNRTTSAGYRFPLASRPRSSDYHDKCVPQQQRKAAQQPAASAAASKDASPKSDVVTQDKIWKDAVEKEKNGVREWEENWGFMTEYDPKGRPITPKEMPEKVNMFSQSLPNTNSGNYGSRLNTDVGQTMQSLEFRFNSGNRKKKLGNDLICY